MKKIFLVIIIILIGVAAVFWVLNNLSVGGERGGKALEVPQREPSRGTVEPNDEINTEPNVESKETEQFSTQDIPGIDPNFKFSATIPANWQVEYIPDSKAINIYMPQEGNGEALEQSKIFAKYFIASSFLTLSTVNIESRAESIINGYPAVTYIIEKKAGVTDFPYQPSWRNIRHRVTDIQSGQDTPAIYYVFAKAPDVSEELFDRFLESLTF